MCMCWHIVGWSDVSVCVCWHIVGWIDVSVCVCWHIVGWSDVSAACVGTSLGGVTSQSACQCRVCLSPLLLGQRSLHGNLYLWKEETGSVVRESEFQVTEESEVRHSPLLCATTPRHATPHHTTPNHITPHHTTHVLINNHKVPLLRD